jgi:hypothetical protein
MVDEKERATLVAFLAACWAQTFREPTVRPRNRARGYLPAAVMSRHGQRSGLPTYRILMRE